MSSNSPYRENGANGVNSANNANGANENSGADETNGTNGGRMSPEAVRERLSSLDGRRFWKSLDELAQTPEFEEMLHREFPQQAAEWADPVGRRRFLQLMGASLAVAGLAGCATSPADKIVPYVRQPEDLVPGRPLFFATAITLGGYATGVLVASHMGRPTKIEGNPDHPASLGATDTFTQASILTMYDPDRSRTVTHLGEIVPYADLLSALRDALAAKKARRGEGLRLLTGAVTSPTLASQIEEMLAAFPEARWHQYEPAGRDAARAGAIAAFGEDAETLYRFDRADIVVSLDADFLGGGPGQVRYVRDFMARRRVEAAAVAASEGSHAGMNRLYAVEATPTVTGAIADHRFRMKPSEVAAFVRALAAQLSVEAGPAGQEASTRVPPAGIAAIARDLRRYAGHSIVVAGREQPPFVHATAHAINAALGNVGRTVVYTDPIEARSVDHTASIRELASDMEAGRVDLLFIVGANPAYDAPADLAFAQRMEKVGLRVHLGLYDDETAARCHWHVPQAHDLESWSDARAYDGTVTILQPLIEPLYGGKTPHELMAAFSPKPFRSPRDIVREHWSKSMPAGAGFEPAWRRALHDGLVAGSALPEKTPALRHEWWSSAQTAGALPMGGSITPAGSVSEAASLSSHAEGVALSPFATPTSRPLHPDSAAPASGSTAHQATQPILAGIPMLAAPPSPPALASAATPAARAAPPSSPAGGGLEVVFRPDAATYDGRYANNGWLQETPRPLTKITWDNAALISPATAARLGLASEDLVDLSLGERTVRAPVWVLPGHADDTVTLHLGYGRERTGRVGAGAGFNAYRVRTSAAPWIAGAAELRRTGARYPIATTQEHQSMEGRAIVRSATLAEARKDPEFAHHAVEAPGKDLTLYPPREYKGHAWGMAIDLAACIGCNACSVACQAENNVPVVGKDQVSRGREMHWIRIDRYFEGSAEDPETWHQPVLCMHCENAPCELVCPVAATVHSSEGLNDMVYNRCVGTRYCSNNCPYKVRRFNFLQYADYTTPSLKLLRNPDVTVRTRGVMEKCTYCVQRINHARNDAEVAGRPIRDGEITTACQQACPAGAIVFGDINDPASRVSRLKADPRTYGLLEETGTRPRTTYLAALRNPNPEIRGGSAD